MRRIVVAVEFVGEEAKGDVLMQEER